MFRPSNLVGLVVLATLGTQHPRAVVAIYVPLIILATIGAVVKMDSLSVNSNAKGAIREVGRHSQTWIMSLPTSVPSARSSGSVSRSVRCCWCNSPNSSRSR